MQVLQHSSCLAPLRISTKLVTLLFKKIFKQMWHTGILPLYNPSKQGVQRLDTPIFLLSHQNVQDQAMTWVGRCKNSISQVLLRLICFNLPSLITKSIKAMHVTKGKVRRSMAFPSNVIRFTACNAEYTESLGRH